MPVCSKDKPERVISVISVVSLKDLGKKWFAFSRMDDLVNDVLQKLERIR